MTTRGRHPLKAIDAARTIAEKRGHVQYSHHGPGRLCDFEIVAPPVLAPIRMKRMDHVRCTLQSLERQAAGEIADLKMYPSSQEISRELWICSRKYFIRFFRITDEGLVELDRDGQVLSPKSSKATRSGRWRRNGTSAPVQSGSGSPTAVSVTDTPVAESGK